MKRFRYVHLTAWACAAGAGLAALSPANAQTFSSSYTSTAPKDCRVISARTGVDDSTIRTCPGKAGLVVVISEDDLREPPTTSPKPNIWLPAPDRTAGRARFSPRTGHLAASHWLKPWADSPAEMRPAVIRSTDAPRLRRQVA
jgi:hypothetical protein